MSDILPDGVVKVISCLGCIGVVALLASGALLGKLLS